MNYEDIKTKSKDELLKTLLDLKKEQMEMRFKHSGGQLDKTHTLRQLRRNVARVQTAMSAPIEEKATKKSPVKKKIAAKKAEKAA